MLLSPDYNLGRTKISVLNAEEEFTPETQC